MLRLFPVSKPKPIIETAGVHLPKEKALAYQELAAALKYQEPSVPRGLESWMDAKQMGVYDLAEVDRFLRSKCYPSKRWCWKPLREADVMANASYGPERHGVIISRPYDKPVPFEALKLIQEIETEFPKQYVFAISDYETRVRRDPDPFLAAIDRTYPRGSVNVVLHWDEPGFCIAR